jgi:hypothetical protein
MKNITTTRLFSQLDACPMTTKEMECFIDLVDIAKLFSDFDIEQVKSFSSTKLDLIYVILRLSNLVHTRFVNSLLENIIIPQLQTTIHCTSLNWYNILFDQLAQDIEHFLHRAIRFCLENNSDYVHQYMISGMIDILKKVSTNEIYQTAFRKLGQKMDKNYFSVNDALFHSIVSDVEEEIRSEFAKTMESLLIFAQDSVDPEIEEDDVEKIMTSLEKIIGLDELMAQECHEIVIYVEQSLANNTSEQDELMIIYQSVSNQGWKIVGRCDERTIEAPLIDHSIFHNREHMISALFKIAAAFVKVPKRCHTMPHITQKTKDELKVSQIETMKYSELYYLVAQYCKVYITVVEMIQDMIKIVATFGESTERPIIVYHHDNSYYTLVRANENFIRAYSHPIDANQVIRKIESMRNKIFISSFREEIKQIFM